MAPRRDPFLKTFLQQCAAAGYKAREAYQKYLDDEIATKINKKPVSQKRFFTIFYEERIALRENYESDLPRTITDETKDYTYDPAQDQHDSFGSEFPEIYPDEPWDEPGDIGDTYRHIPSGVGGQGVDTRQGLSVQAAGRRQRLGMHPELIGSVFAGMGTETVGARKGPKFNAAWRELTNFYATFKLDTLYARSGENADKNCSSFTAQYWNRLVHCYERISDLSLGAESANDVDMRKKSRLLKVLAAEQLAFWHITTVTEKTFRSSRPKVENIFFTEFWKWPARNFADIVLNPGATRPNTGSQQNEQLRNSPISTLMENWVIIPTDSDADEDEISCAPYQELLRTLTKGRNNSAGSEFRITVPIQQNLAEFRKQSYLAEYVPPETLNVPHFQRKNNHTIESLVRAIKEHGFTNPIFVIKETNTILNGTQRWWAAKELGIDQIPVFFVSLDPESHARFLKDGDLTLEEDFLDTFYIRNPFTEFLKTRRFPLTYFFLNTARLLGRKHLIKHPLDMADDTSLKAWALKINKQQHPGEWSSEAQRVFGVQMSR